MSGECDKCGEHTVDCVCEEDLTSISELPEGLALSIINNSLERVDKAIQHIDNHVLNWTQEEWEKTMIAWMTSRGWVNDRNDETTLGFSLRNKDEWWIRDYDKRSRTFIHYNGNQKINLVSNGSKTD